MALLKSYLPVLIVVVIILAGVLGYFVGSAAVPTHTVTTTTTLTRETTVTVTAAPKVEPIKWTMVVHIPAADHRFAYWKEFTELVKNMSNGRLVIELFPGGVLFPITQHIEATAKGTIQIGYANLGFWAAEDPLFALASNRPGPLVSPYEAMYEAYSIMDLIAKHLERRGVILLGPATYSPPEVFICRSPLKSIDDLRGRLVRALGLGASFYEALGAKSVVITPAELYTALQLGTVDCAELSYFYGNLMYKTYEVAKYVIKPVSGCALHTQGVLEDYMFVNPKAWNELPDDLKLIVNTSRQIILKKMFYDFPRFESYAEGLHRNYGVSIRTLEPGEVEKIRAVAVSTYVEYAKKDPDVLEMVKRLAKVWRELGYEDWSTALESALKSAGLT